MTTGPGLYNCTNIQLATNLKEFWQLSFSPIQVILGKLEWHYA